MSYLATALTRALADLGTNQVEFSAKSGISRVQVNRAARGSATTGRDVIGRIARALPDPHNGRVLAAWLRDEMPEDLRGLVDLLPGGDSLTLSEVSPEYGTRLDDRRAKLLAWVKLQIINTEFCDLLDSLRAAIEATK